MRPSSSAATHLDHDKASAAAVRGTPVDRGLVAGDIEALHRSRGDRGKASNASDDGGKGLHVLVAVVAVFLVRFYKSGRHCCIYTRGFGILRSQAQAITPVATFNTTNRLDSRCADTPAPRCKS